MGNCCKKIDIPDRTGPQVRKPGMESATSLSQINMMDETIPNDILNALQEAFKDDGDSCARVIYFLTKRLSSDCAEPFIKSLQDVLSNSMLFKKKTEKLVKKTKTADEDPQYHEFLNYFLKDMITDPDGCQRLALDMPAHGHFSVAQYNFMRAVSRLTPESFKALTTAVSATGGQMAVYGGRVIAIARKAEYVENVALVKEHLTTNITMNITRWWNGEISGENCATNIVDDGLGLAAGIGGGSWGGTIGASVGSFLGPLGTAGGAIAGAVAGGFLATRAAELLCDKLKQWVFGLPKSEALENAYTFLGTSSNDSNSAINKAYRHLAVKYHPDKGGDADKWTQLQYSLAVIREARGES